jgi:hypothetical protein
MQMCTIPPFTWVWNLVCHSDGVAKVKDFDTGAAEPRASALMLQKPFTVEP